MPLIKSESGQKGVDLAAKKRADRRGVQVKGTRETKSLERRLAKAMAHPLRVEMLKLLNDGEWSPRELETELGEGLSQISYHVKVLKDFELIEMTRTEPRRGAVEHYYRATERAFVRAGQTADIPKSAQGIIVANRVQEIDEDLNPSLRSGMFYDRDDWHASRTPAVFDGQGREAVEKLCDEFIDRYLAIAGDTANRIAMGEDDGERVWTTAALLVFTSEIAEQEAEREERRKQRRKKSK
jgi:DNA-binding transcriptional ArsR family regulator